jgi:hypothetical protein
MESNKAYYDQRNRMGEAQQLHIDDLVLVHQGTGKDINSRSVNLKIDDRWFGPGGIREIPQDSTFYLVEELDGTHLRARFSGDRLRCFFSRPNLRGSNGTT